MKSSALNRRVNTGLVVVLLLEKKTETENEDEPR
jgi:hypothetical protein